MNSIIIDGYNLIHRVPDLRKDLDVSLEQARGTLIRMLKTYLLNKRVKITLVFDGNQAPPGLPSVEQLKSLKIIFSRAPFKADPLILTMISQTKKRGGLIIVSDDSEITARAKAAGASVVSTKDFYSRLVKRPRDVMDAKSDSNLSDEELAEWLEIFGEN